MPAPDELSRYAALRDIVARLRAVDGCPWDREQTHDSLKPYLLQEAYEVLAALDEGNLAALPEEMGDLLFQILIHAQLAEEAGEFAMTDVLAALSDKLVRRHPHVFGETKLESAGEVVEQWDRLKRDEREPASSALAGVPRVLPALAYAQELMSRAGRAGFEWPDKGDVLLKLAEEIAELERAEDQRQRTEEFGDVLINLVNYARFSGIDAEEALRLAANKFRARFEKVETMARAAGRPMTEMTIGELLELWAKAKVRATGPGAQAP